MFVGSIGMTQYLGVTAGPLETINASLAQRLLGSGVGFYVMQFSTLAILAVAANTSFSGFPRVASFLSHDRFLPRQLYNLGDRLVFNNGIVLLSGLTALLIILFNGNSHRLVPLFAVGAFTAFTLSQVGMVRYWQRRREGGWQFKAFTNGLGALVTAATLIIISVSKFIEGAWISLLVIPLMVVLFYRIHDHYRSVAKQLSLRGLPPSLRPTPRPRVVIPVSGVHRGMLDAINFARAISDDVTAVYIDINPDRDEEAMRRQWEAWLPDVPLVTISSPYRSIVEPLLEFLNQTDLDHHDGQQAVLVLPELIPASPWQEILHNQSADMIKEALLYKRRFGGFQRVIIDVPYHLKSE